MADRSDNPEAAAAAAAIGRGPGRWRWRWRWQPEPQQEPQPQPEPQSRAGSRRAKQRRAAGAGAPAATPTRRRRVSGEWRGAALVRRQGRQPGSSVRSQRRQPEPVSSGSRPPVRGGARPPCPAPSRSRLRRSPASARPRSTPARSQPTAGGPSAVRLDGRHPRPPVRHPPRGRRVNLIVGIVALVVVGAAVMYGLWRLAPSVALRRIGAVPIDEHDDPRLYNVTEGLCATFGLSMPTLHVVDDDVPNACALGRDARRSDLVVTTGLLRRRRPHRARGRDRPRARTREAGRQRRLVHRHHARHRSSAASARCGAASVRAASTGPMSWARRPCATPRGLLGALH